MSVLEEKALIGTILTQYGSLIDDLRLDEAGALFCQDGVWEAHPLRFETPAGIAGGLRGIEPPKPGMVKHVTFTPIIEVEGETAHSWADAMALLVGPPASIVAVGRYYDVLKKEAGLWRFQRRVFVPSGQDVPDDLKPLPGPSAA